MKRTEFFSRRILPSVSVCYIIMCINVFILSVDSNLEYDRNVQLSGARRELSRYVVVFIKGFRKIKQPSFQPTWYV
jgi:hypothetical protein